jgi:16S rRNA C967 or C1407 C5-methylase (RsmB/RsmF family)/NOL1/NOP2/fmu family ribosome biogenesis protein
MNEFHFPSPFATRMQQQLGSEWKDFVAAHHVPSPTSIRINPKKSSAKEFEEILWTEFGYYLNQRPSFTLDPLFHAGTYYVQEASSMFLEQALKQSVDLSKSMRVLDLCAAPGGKSTHLLSLISEDSLLVSNEVIKTRATILAENSCKWGNLNVAVTNNDPEDFLKLKDFFDVILIDAPCSGEGLFRKDPQAVNEWSEENAQLCSLRQQRILNQIWPALKTNGILIYSTCTYNSKENGENLEPWILSGKAESLKLKLETDWSIEENSLNGVTGYQFYPHKVRGEGFFISVLKKKEHQDEMTIHSKKEFHFVSKKLNERLSEWMLQPDKVDFIQNDDLVLALPKKNTEEIGFLSRNLRVIQKGTAVATVKHEKLIPEHAFALSNEINKKHFQVIAVDEGQAINYLRKETLMLPSEKKGFALLQFQDTPLGWINHLGNRINNLYPSNWRIRN